MLSQPLTEAAGFSLASMTDALKTQAKNIYVLLVTSAKDKSLGLFRCMDKFNGLKQHYEPDVAGQHANMFCGLLAPEW